MRNKLDLSIFSREITDIRPVLGEPKAIKILESVLFLISSEINFALELKSEPNLEVITVTL